MRQPRERLACQRRLETLRLSQILEKSGPPEGIPVPKSRVSGRPHRCETQRACGKITREYATRVRHSPNTRRPSLVLEREALIGEREPLADKGASHAVCARELKERVTRLREEIRRQAGRQHVDVEDLRKNVDPREDGAYLTAIAGDETKDRARTAHPRAASAGPVSSATLLFFWLFRLGVANSSSDQVLGPRQTGSR